MMAHSHSKLHPFFFPLASGSSGLGASFTFSVSSSEKASVRAFAASLADVLVGVSAFISLTALALGAFTTTGSSTTLGSSTALGSSTGASASSSVLATETSSAETSASDTTSDFAFLVDLPRDLDFDLLVFVS